MMKRETNRAFLGFGGNLGAPLDNFRKACRGLASHPEIELRRRSPLYLTPPCGGPAGQPEYMNGVLEIATTLPAEQLLKVCLQLEAEAGRNREVRWGARTLDIDLLFYADLVKHSTFLTLPHPRLHERHFVLLPLTDLEPGLRHPRLQKTACELLAALPAADGIKQLTESWGPDD